MAAGSGARPVLRVGTKAYVSPVGGSRPSPVSAGPLRFDAGVRTGEEETFLVVVEPVHDVRRLTRGAAHLEHPCLAHRSSDLVAVDDEPVSWLCLHIRLLVGYGCSVCLMRQDFQGPLPDTGRGTVRPIHMDERRTNTLCRVSETSACPFCDRLVSDATLLVSEPNVAAFPDAFPVSPGHALVVPRTHEADFFALAPEVQRAVWEAVRDVRTLLAGSHAPDGFNVGLNAGIAAGQTVEHAHVHVIPRYRGDVDDPRGGVRCVVHERARYWER